MTRSRVLQGFDAETLSSLLADALGRGGDYADLFFEEHTSSGLLLEDGKVKSATAGRSGGVGVRVLAGERTGYAYTEELTPRSVRRAARTAAAIADGGDNVGPVSVSRRERSDLYRAERAYDELTPSKKVTLLHQAHAACAGVDPRVVRVTVRLDEGVKDIAIVSSLGTIVEDVQPMISIRASCVAEDGDNRTRGMNGDAARRGLEMLTPELLDTIGRRAGEQAVRNLAAQDAPAGPQPVVLGPAYSGVLLHEAVGHGLEADFNRRGLSRYSGQIGERVASDLVTVIDDGTMPSERGSINVDDEGHASGSAVLIENGILRGYMHDRLSARLMDTDPTGNGRRESYAHTPMPRMTNTFMPAGTHDPEEIIQSVDRGIYAVQFGGGQVEIGKGDFMFLATEAYLIEGGKVTSPLRDVTLIGNGPEVMGRVEMVGTDYRTSEGMWQCGKDGQGVPVGVGMPTVKISSITVGGTA